MVMKRQKRWRERKRSFPLSQLTASIGCKILFLLAEAGLLELTSLLIRRVEAILAGLLVDLLGSEVRQLLGGADIGHLLEVSLGENQVDLFERSSGTVFLR